MIQRIQSLYLLIIVVLSVALFFIPISTKIISADASKGILADVSYKMSLTGIEKYENGRQVSTSSNYLLLILNIAAALISATVIFLFKNRNLQIKLSRLCMVLICAFIAIDFYFSDALGKEYGIDFKTMYGAGSYFPIIQIILLIMAIRAIKKDDALVRSAERIR